MGFGFFVYILIGLKLFENGFLFIFFLGGYFFIFFDWSFFVCFVWIGVLLIWVFGYWFKDENFVVFENFNEYVR